MDTREQRGLELAVLYARVSTREQGKTGFSIAGQLHALREHSKQEGLMVVEECVDDGFSRDNLLRPGLMRIRELAVSYYERGTPLTVYAWKRDRYGEAPYPEILALELAPYGATLRSLDDLGEGDDAELLNAVKDTMARKERRDLIRRTRMGKYQKAREGKVLAGGKPPFGYRFSTDGSSLVEHPEELATLKRMFEWAAQGLGPMAIQHRLKQAGIPSPSGNDVWQPRSIKYVLTQDLYRSYAPQQIEDSLGVKPEAGRYGIKWSNRQYHRRWQEGERYRHRHTKTDRDEWIGIPVARHLAEELLPPDLVEPARTKLISRKAPGLKHKVRVWELNGFLKCSCGHGMGGLRRTYNGKTYLYYRCYSSTTQRRYECSQGYLRGEPLEEMIWQAVSRVLTDPASLRRIEEEAKSLAEAPEGNATEAEALHKVLEGGRAQRENYHRMVAEGLIEFPELKARLEELEGKRNDANARLDVLRSGLVEADKNAQELEGALGKLSGLTEEDLRGYTPERRRELYDALDVEILVAGKTLYLSGVFFSEGKHIQEHFAERDEVRVNAETFACYRASLVLADAK